MEHTQGKLRTRNKELVAYEGYASTVIGQANSLANAKRLVKCWNGYDGLVEVCIKAHDALLCLHVCDQDQTFATETRQLIKKAITEAEKE